MRDGPARVPRRPVGRFGGSEHELVQAPGADEPNLEAHGGGGRLLSGLHPGGLHLRRPAPNRGPPFQPLDLLGHAGLVGARGLALADQKAECRSQPDGLPQVGQGKLLLDAVAWPFVDAVDDCDFLTVADRAEAADTDVEETALSIGSFQLLDVAILYLVGRDGRRGREWRAAGVPLAPPGIDGFLAVGGAVEDDGGVAGRGMFRGGRSQGERSVVCAGGYRKFTPPHL